MFISSTGSFALLKDNFIEFYDNLNQLSWAIKGNFFDFFSIIYIYYYIIITYKS